MNIAVLATCTNRKKVIPQKSLLARNLPRGTQENLLQRWTQHVRAEIEVTRAIDLYCGRGFSEIKKVISSSNALVWVISFGMGLISIENKVPSYQITLTNSSEDSITDKIIPSMYFNPSEWWSAINQELHGKKHPISDLISNTKDTLFVLSTSHSYLSLVMSDIFRLVSEDLEKVRIVGPPNPSLIPHQFRHLWMPYDARFDGPRCPNPGTRSDYPQRIARHFVEHVLSLSPHSCAEEHAQIVEAILKDMPVARIIERKSLPDHEIVKIIDKNWDLANGSSARMLRILRDQEHVACEQSRFAAIFRNIKAEKLHV